uniref:Uncharacterized protein LOC113791039 n=2 Tax=Dermatophagoides pteronyssinus TaxID=6956 RepID=A0A6P6XXC4_DERPT|nr:uncharacterized protein LOC113791039 [Dermatophagoides pteronyssinus]
MIIEIMNVFGSSNIFELPETNVSSIGWKLSVEKIFSGSISCGLKYLPKTIGFSFHENNIFQFIKDNDLKVIVYPRIWSHIKESKQKIQFDLSIGRRYYLAEIDRSMREFLTRFDQHSHAHAMAIVAKTSDISLFAFLFHQNDNNFTYGYHLSSEKNINVGNMDDCDFNPNCPSSFASIIMINTDTKIFILTTKMLNDSSKNSLQNFHLDKIIGYFCMLKEQKNQIILSKTPCKIDNHNLNENDRLIHFDYGFVFNHQLYLIDKKNNEVWEIDSKILSHHGKKSSIIIRKMDDVFYCSPNHTETMKPTTINIQTTNIKTKMISLTTKPIIRITTTTTTVSRPTEKSSNYNSLIIAIIVYIGIISIGLTLFIYFKRNLIIDEYVKMTKRSVPLSRFSLFRSGIRSKRMRSAIGGWGRSNSSNRSTILSTELTSNI